MPDEEEVVDDAAMVDLGDDDLDFADDDLDLDLDDDLLVDEETGGDLEPSEME